MKKQNTEVRRQRTEDPRAFLPAPVVSQAQVRKQERGTSDFRNLKKEAIDESDSIAGGGDVADFSDNG